MKKLTLIAVFALTAFTVSQAQDFSQAFGIRGGYGAELSYQHPLSGNTRLEADLGLYGFHSTGFVLTGIHQWVFGIQDGFNWYAGVGAEIGSLEGTFGLGAAGQIGIEYYIPSVPIQLSLDYRPSWFILPSNYAFNAFGGVGLGIRYTF